MRRFYQERDGSTSEIIPLRTGWWHMAQVDAGMVRDGTLVIPWWLFRKREPGRDAWITWLNPEWWTLLRWSLLYALFRLCQWVGVARVADCGFIWLDVSWHWDFWRSPRSWWKRNELPNEWAWNPWQTKGPMYWMAVDVPRPRAPWRNLNDPFRLKKEQDHARDAFVAWILTNPFEPVTR